MVTPAPNVRPRTVHRHVVAARHTLLAAILLVTWLVPAAMGQSLAYAPNRLPLWLVIRAASDCAIQLPPAPLLDAYERYTLEYLDTFRELDAAYAAAMASSSAMRGEVPDGKEERVASQMRRRSLEHATRLTDELLDVLAPLVPPEQVERVAAFRDEVHTRALWASMPRLFGQWVRVDAPFNLPDLIAVSTGPNDRGAVAWADLCSAYRLTAASRRAVAVAIWSEMDEARMRAARTASQVGLSGLLDTADQGDSDSARWYELVSQVQAAASLDEQVRRAHAKAMWEFWVAARGALPAPVRSRTMGELQRATSVGDLMTLSLPAQVDSARSQDGAHIVRTALALPGLTDSQRAQLREVGLKWIDDRTRLIEGAFEALAGGTSRGDAWQELLALDVSARDRLAEISGAAWLRARVDANGNPLRTTVSVPSSLVNRSGFVLSASDDAAVPLINRAAVGGGGADETEAIGRATLRYRGMPAPPQSSCKSRAASDLGLSEGESAVVDALLDDMWRRWGAEVEPRVQKLDRATREFTEKSNAPSIGSDAEREAYYEDYRVGVKTIALLREDAWRQANLEWNALAAALGAALPPGKRDLAVLWVQNERAEMCMPPTNSRLRVPAVTALIGTRFSDPQARDRAAAVLAAVAAEQVDRLDAFRSAFTRSGDNSLDIMAIEIGRSPDECAPEIAIAREATRSAYERVMAGGEEVLDALCRELTPPACTEARRAYRTQQVAGGGIPSLRPVPAEVQTGPAQQTAQSVVDREQPRLDALADLYLDLVLREPIELFDDQNVRARTSPYFLRASVLAAVANDLYTISLWRIRSQLPPDAWESSKTLTRLRALDDLLAAPQAQPAAPKNTP